MRSKKYLWNTQNRCEICDTRVTMKSAMFWGVTLSSLVDIWRSFGKVYSLHLEGWRASSQLTCSTYSSTRMSLLKSVHLYQTIWLHSPEGSRPDSCTPTHTRHSNTYVVWYAVRCCAIFCVVPGKKQGHAVAYLVEALCYKPEGRGFHSRCDH
jgi:hypothetical protein